MGLETELVMEAPAKINLFLRIVSRRPDGYHDIDSLMQKIDLVDVVRLSRKSGAISLECPGTDLPVDHTNLAFRAAQAFRDRVAPELGVHIVLEKRIPVAAGLGGGSSDAAAVLLGLNRLYGAGLNEEQLVELARPLGADVPFFVTPYGAARATGIGDVLEPVGAPWNHWIVLVNPGFSVSTKWVYQNFALTTQGNPYILGREKIDKLHSGISRQDISQWLVNDLEDVTIPSHPEIKAIKENLLSLGAVGALMSGSGPTVFGLFDNEAQANHCAQVMRNKYGTGVFVTHSMKDM